MTTQAANEYPLLFNFQDTVSGQGFLAGVTISGGRGLMVHEGEWEWWMYGVRPGAIAESGKTFEETYLKFKNRYREVLYDIADEAVSFDDFRTEVERFFYQPEITEETRWQAAFERVRSGQNIPEPISTLPRRKPEEQPSTIGIRQLDSEQTRFQPSDNALDSYYIPDYVAA